MGWGWGEGRGCSVGGSVEWRTFVQCRKHYSRLLSPPPQGAAAAGPRDVLHLTDTSLLVTSPAPPSINFFTIFVATQRDFPLYVVWYNYLMKYKKSLCCNGCQVAVANFQLLSLNHREENRDGDTCKSDPLHSVLSTLNACH